MKTLLILAINLNVILGASVMYRNRRAYPIGLEKSEPFYKKFRARRACGQ